MTERPTALGSDSTEYGLHIPSSGQAIAHRPDRVHVSHGARGKLEEEAEMVSSSEDRKCWMIMSEKKKDCVMSNLVAPLSCTKNQLPSDFAEDTKGTEIPFHFCFHAIVDDWT